MRYNFSKTEKAGYIAVKHNKSQGVQCYGEGRPFGFIDQTSAFPPRQMYPSRIISADEGFIINESGFYVDPECEENHFNHYGMTFRMNAPAGAYQIRVKTTSEIEEDYLISISGMHADRLLQKGFWDAPEQIPVLTTAKVNGKEWTFNYVNGRSFIDIEIEPRKLDTPVGIEEIVLHPIEPQARPEVSLPNLFILGDSTVKTYTFEEAPMSGWGQIIGSLFDRKQINVLNYSMGGRSFKNAYAEGRFNDILMSGQKGDYIMIQFGHNDERKDEFHRYGRGSTEAMYSAYIKDIYIPAIRAREMVPILVTPLSRVKGEAKQDHTYTNSFKARKFPDIMKSMGKELGVTVIDLNSESIKYYNSIGVEATTAIYMSIEAGETPGKTNDGSYANGHPANKMDGTHFKEALSKQFARMVVTQLMNLGEAGDSRVGELAAYLRREVMDAIFQDDWSNIYSEITCDTTVGKGAYYRNQIEKLIQIGVMHKDGKGNFYPHEPMYVEEFLDAITKLMDLKRELFDGYQAGALTREMLGAILFDAYSSKFTQKPYDPNLDTGRLSAGYDPIVSYTQLTDVHAITPELKIKVKGAYKLGLFRAEKGILRGALVNGTELEPKRIVTRELAAKALYFMWVLIHSVKERNDQK